MHTMIVYYVFLSMAAMQFNQEISVVAYIYSTFTILFNHKRTMQS